MLIYRNLLLLALLFQFAAAQKVSTYCNPVNLNYRFVLGGASGREAADPTMIYFKGNYYLFASKSGGYWRTTDLASWTFIASKTLPIEVYAPTVVAIGDTLYYTASYAKEGRLYKTADPNMDSWEICEAILSIGTPDAALFLDDDDRLYVYYGTSPTAPISGAELNKKTFDVVGKPVALFKGDPAQHGWEVAGDDNNNPKAPSWMEGPWMTKIDSIYYLQYAAPGTIYNTYADGYYTSKSPLGPFEYALTNPFSFKPGGFVNGAGHGNLFQDSYNKYWHITSSVISVINRFERRLCLFPVSFDRDKVLYANTYAGDFPHWLPGKSAKKPEDYFTGWMPLSYRKKTVASSSLSEKYSVFQAVDENIKTHWAAKTAEKGEWLMVDLGRKSRIHAIQINFAEHAASIFGRDAKDFHQYRLQYSNDKKIWKTIVDKSQNTTSVPHDYIELHKPLKARYVKLINAYVPDSNFAVSDFRIFGTAPVKRTKALGTFSASRNAKDPRRVLVSWVPVRGATGYIIRFGIHPEKLYHSYLVYDQDKIEINSLNVGVNYYFAIDTFNERGITKGKTIVNTR